MNPDKAQTLQGRWMRRFYRFVVFFLALSGFAQMPIFKRYYIADIPGLGWLASFYTTHYIHYLGATVFLGFVGYLATDFFLRNTRKVPVTVGGIIQMALIGGIVMTGALLVYKNLSGYSMPPETIVMLDLGHLGLVLAYLATGLYGGLIQKE